MAHGFWSKKPRHIPLGQPISVIAESRGLLAPWACTSAVRDCGRCRGRDTIRICISGFGDAATTFRDGRDDSTGSEGAKGMASGDGAWDGGILIYGVVLVALSAIDVR